MACRTSTAAWVTSGPMPSPGRTTMSARMLQLLVAGDVGMLLQQVAELVGTLEQAGLGEGIQREQVAAAVGQGHAACGHVDVQFEAGLRNQLIDDGLVEHDRQQAVLERVAAEDVRDLAADDGTQAEVAQRPGRVLARRAATEG